MHSKSPFDDVLTLHAAMQIDHIRNVTDINVGQTGSRLIRSAPPPTHMKNIFGFGH